MAAQSTVKRKFKFSELFTNMDIPMVISVLALLVLGLVVLYSASMPLGFAYDYHPIEDVIDQGRWVLLGLALAFGISLVDYRKIRPFIMILLLGAITSLILVLIIGEERFGATRTFFNGRVQPSEITKVILILYLAFWLKSKSEYLSNLFVWGMPLGIVLGAISVLLFLEPDFSALLTILLISAIMLFLANIAWLQALVVAVAGTGLFAFVIKFTSTGEFRWNQFITGWHDPSAAISQVQRAFESIVDGGLFGVGIGQGTVKFTGLEVGQTDTIFTIIAEEMGLVGILFVLGLFSLLMWRGIKIAQESKDRTGQLIAAGITFWIITETFFNIASLINLIPIGGNTLPFFSKGGSSLVSIMVGIGLVLSVSRVNKREKQIERSSKSAVVDMRWRDRRRSVPRSRGTTSTRSSIR